MPGWRFLWSFVLPLGRAGSTNRRWWSFPWPIGSHMHRSISEPPDALGPPRRPASRRCAGQAGNHRPIPGPLRRLAERRFQANRSANGASVLRPTPVGAQSLTAAAPAPQPMSTAIQTSGSRHGTGPLSASYASVMNRGEQIARNTRSSGPVLVICWVHRGGMTTTSLGLTCRGGWPSRETSPWP